MGRSEAPVPDGPLGEFAQGLRRLRAAAGGPSYRALESRAGYSASALSLAAAGARLPSLEVTLAYVGACGGDMPGWERRWRVLAAHLAGDEGRDELAGDGMAAAEPISEAHSAVPGPLAAVGERRRVASARRVLIPVGVALVVAAAVAVPVVLAAGGHGGARPVGQVGGASGGGARSAPVGGPPSAAPAVSPPPASPPPSAADPSTVAPPGGAAVPEPVPVTSTHPQSPVSSSGSGGGTVQAAFTAVDGPSCPEDARRGVNISSWPGALGWAQARPAGYGGAGCADWFLYSSLTLNPTASPRPENYFSWLFTLDAAVPERCSVAVFVPDSPLAGQKVWYYADDVFDNPQHTNGRFQVDQASGRGRWVDGGAVTVATGKLMIQIGDDGSGNPGGVSTIIASVLRVSCIHA